MTSLDAVLRAYDYQPTRDDGFCHRYLTLPAGLIPNVEALDKVVRKIRTHPSHDRPASVTLVGEGIEGEFQRKTQLMGELLHLCQGNLKRLELINNMDRDEDDLAISVIRREHIGSLVQLDSLSLIGLDLEGDEALVGIFACHNCRISYLEIDWCPSVAHILASYKKLTKLKLYDGGSADDVRDCLQAIQQSPSRLTHLYLKDVATTHQHLAHMAATLQHQTQLRVLDLASGDLFWDTARNAVCSVEDAQGFMDALAHHPQLEHVLFGSNRISNDLLEAVLVAAEQTPHLTRLSFAVCGRLDGLGRWVDVLPRMTHLRSLTGLQGLVSKPGWSSHVLPNLRQNTSLVELGPDTEVVQPILARNRLLQLTSAPSFHCGNLALWPRVLAQMACDKVDASARFGFLVRQAARIPEPRLVAENKGLKRRLLQLQRQAKTMKTVLETLGTVDTVAKMQQTLAGWQTHQDGPAEEMGEEKKEE